MTALKKMARSDAMRFAAELARDREFRRDLRRAGRKAAALGERRDLLSASGRKELGRRSAALAADVERALRRVERRRRGRRRRAVLVALVAGGIAGSVGLVVAAPSAWRSTGRRARALVRLHERTS